MGNETLKIRELKENPAVLYSGSEISLRVLSANDREGRFVRDVADMTVWRNFYPDAYLTVFFATWERTYNWLIRHYMPSDTDLMIMFEDSRRVPFGHIAFVDFRVDELGSRCELSRVVRGPGLGPQGGMKKALAKALEWAAGTFSIDAFTLRVFADNNRAVQLYESTGFVKSGEIGMAKVETGDGYRWKEVGLDKAERKEIHMIKKVL